MHIIGLTGLIGSGKSTVAEIFAALGVPIIDTDVIAYQLTCAGGKALPQIELAFGSHIIGTDGALERHKMRELVFNQAKLRVVLEQILHPMIYTEVKHQISHYRTCPYVVVVVPLLFRSPQYLALVARTIFVDSDYDKLLDRLKLRSNLQKLQVDAILSQQVSREEQLKMADDIIENNGDKAFLLAQVQNLHDKYVYFE